MLAREEADLKPRAERQKREGPCKGHKSFVFIEVDPVNLVPIFDCVT